MLSFGSDPEFMILDQDKLVSAIDVVGHDVTDRIKNQGHEFYYDNVLAECAIKPSYSRDEALNNIGEAIKIYSDLVKPYRIEAIASADYPSEALNNIIAKTAGCATETCAYLMREMAGSESAANLIRTGTLRTGGGHIHLGHEILSSGGPEAVFCIYAMDLFLGLPSLIMDKDPTSKRRRLIYGKAGRYRTKPYGVEYRTLGNFWLSSPKLVELIYDISAKVVDIIQDQDLWEFDLDKYYELDSAGKDVGPAFQFKPFDKFKIKEIIDGKELDVVFFENVFWRPYLGTLVDRIFEQANSKQSFISEWGI